jgi:hypothetical protein
LRCYIATYQQADFTEQVVVYAGIGMRSWIFRDFKCFRPSRWVTDAVCTFAQREALTKDSYDVVHLRSGNKPWAGGSLADTEDDRKKEIESNWPNLEAYFHDLYNRYKALPNKKEDLIILTDSVWLGRQWIKHYHCGRMLPGFKTKINESGLHKLTQSDLSDIDVDKERLNYEMLRDFFVMLNAKNVVSDGISMFSKLAVQVKSAGVNPCCFKNLNPCGDDDLQDAAEQKAGG